MALLKRAFSKLAALPRRRVAFLAPVAVVLVVGAVLVAQGNGSTVQTADEARKQQPRRVSTSKNLPEGSAATTTKAKKAAAEPAVDPTVTPTTALTAPTKAKPAPVTASAEVHDPVPVSQEAGGQPQPHLLPVRPPEPWPQGSGAPLTNLGFDPPEGKAGPAVAVKVSNAPEADPHTNLHRADLIYELRAEDVSRFIAVYHSRAADVIGPIRSGRTADPLIVKSLGRPMLVFSGGNDFVMNMMQAREDDGTLVQMTNGRALGQFFRSDDRRLPHNFYGHRPGWIAARGAEAAPPKRQTDFGGGTGVNTATGQPVKVSVSIGDSDSWWQWDATSQMWLRFQHGRPHVDKDTGFQIGRTSVVILGTDYPPSEADRRSPEAVSKGRGEAWVLTGRDYIHGQWIRASAEDTWHLVDDQDNPIKLTAGPVYIGLTGTAPRIE